MNAKEYAIYRASVIIPVYDAEKTLERCVESLLYGRERNLEVLLLDDCSKDGSRTLCQTLAEKYDHVRAFRNETNRGFPTPAAEDWTKSRGSIYFSLTSTTDAFGIPAVASK